MRRLPYLAVGIATVLASILPSAALAAPPEPNLHSNVPAHDMELAKKVQVRGDRGGAKPQRSSPTLATGTLADTYSGPKYAILIGISNYPGTSSDLALCDEDALDMRDALVNKYGFTYDHIYMLLDREAGEPVIAGSLPATRQNIFDKIAQVKSVVDGQGGGEVVFFYSGHGGRAKADDGDTELVDECIWSYNGNSFDAIWDGELATAFYGWKADRLVFIFDSCYSGGMTDLAGAGRIVAMASTENALSYELSNLGNGEFTYWMIQQGMSALLADTKPQEGKVSVEEAFDYAKLNCRYDSPTASDLFTKDMLP